MTLLGLRIRNPGDIRAGVAFVGVIGQQQGFAVFDTAAHGIRAIGVILCTYYRVHGINTIRGAISRYAPPSENNTAAYIADVSARTGYSADAKLNFLSTTVLAKLIGAIIYNEIGMQPYTAGQLGLCAAQAIEPAPHQIRAAFNQGTLPTMAVFNRATIPLGVDFDKLISAMQAYVGAYVFPVWGTRIKLVKSTDFIPGAWAMVFLDDADAPGALAYHDLTPDGLPQCKVFVKTTLQAGDLVSVSASHELVECLVDPAINMMVTRPDNNVFYAYESADPCETEVFLVNGIAMSDFVYPAYFETFHAPGSVRFDRMNKISRPFQILPGGYQITFSNGNWGQVFGSREKAAKFAKEDRRGHRSELREKGPLQKADPVEIAKESR